MPKKGTAMGYSYYAFNLDYICDRKLQVLPTKKKKTLDQSLPRFFFNLDPPQMFLILFSSSMLVIQKYANFNIKK